MVVGRRWTVDDFETLLVQAPVDDHTWCGLLVWGGYDAVGQAASRTFRLTDERDYADAREKSISTPRRPCPRRRWFIRST